MYLVFDTGGTKMRLAFSPDGTSLNDPVIFETPRQFTDAMSKVEEIVPKLTAGAKLKGVAGGMPGAMNQDRSVVLNSPNLPGWSNKPLKKELERITKSKVHIENDTAMVGLGEVDRGAGCGFGIAVYLTVSTGVGGTRIVDGRIDRSTYGFEPGWQIINMNGFEAGAEDSPYLEKIISGSAMEKKFGKSPKDIDNPDVWDMEAKRLAYGLNNVVVMWSPQCIVIGGSMMKDIPLDKTQQYLKEVHHIFPSLPEIRLAQLGDLGGLYGALAYLNQKPSR